jgi:hypothetical protein
MTISFTMLFAASFFFVNHARVEVTKEVLSFQLDDITKSSAISRAREPCKT